MLEEDEEAYKRSFRKALLWGVILGVIVLAVLSGCQTYQPPGEDLWLTVR